MMMSDGEGNRGSLVDVEKEVFSPHAMESVEGEAARQEGFRFLAASSIEENVIQENDATQNFERSNGESPSGPSDSTASIPTARILENEAGWTIKHGVAARGDSEHGDDASAEEKQTAAKCQPEVSSTHPDSKHPSEKSSKPWREWMQSRVNGKQSAMPKKGILIHEFQRKRKEKDRTRSKRARTVRFHLKKRRDQSFHLLAPDSAFLDRWQMFMVVGMSYEIWAFPYRLALVDETNFAQIILADVCFDLLFLCDMAVQMSTRVPPNTFSDQDEALTHTQDIARAYLRHKFPFEIMPSGLYYIMTAIFLPRCADGICWLWWLSTIPRMLPRARRLLAYFRSKECDLKVSVRALQGVKFSLILFLSAHWVGCVFYWLARLQHFDDVTWVSGFEGLLPKFSRATSVGPERYLICLYKGFNSLSNLEYDLGLPLNPVEMLWSIVVMGFQVYMSALILGTLLNYLVAKDPAGEAHKKKLEKIAQFAEAKGLPEDLQSRVYQYLHFQFEKNVQNKAAVSMVLPKNLEIKVADSKYRSILDKCSQKGNALNACDPNFLNAMLVKLHVVHLMAGEEFVAQNGIPRELFFVLEGTVHVMDRENRVERIIRHDVPDMAPICGEVPFFLGINHHSSIRAQPNGSVQLLVLSRGDFEELMLSYPEEQEHINSNILATFNLDVDGEDLETGHDDADNDRDKVLLRENIITAIKRRAQERFASLVFAAASGDLQTVSLLARQGADIDQQDYDGRTILHMAAADGNYKLVENLLDMGAEKNLKNRWGNTPLAEAINNRQVLIIGLLCQWRAQLGLDNPASLLCQAASTGDIEVVRRLVENNVDANIGDYDGRTALHIASAEGQDKVVEYLLSKQADPNCEDRWGGKPLLDAVKGAHTVLAGLLRSKGAQLPEGIGTEQVCEASGKGDVRQLRLLHECGQSVEVGDYDSRFPLHLAAAEARILAVSYLLGISADPNCVDRWGGTPLDDALRGGTTYHLYCAKLIAGWGGKLGVLAGTAEGEKKMKELEEIDITNVRKLIKKLIENGYDNSVRSRQTPEELAVARQATVLHLPLVAEMFERTHALRSLLRENSDACADGIDTLKESIIHVASALDSNRCQRNAGRKASMGAANMGELCSRLSTCDSKISSASMAPGSPLMSSMVHEVLAKLEDPAFEEEEMLEQEFIEAMESDEEDALYHEIDQLVEAQERAQLAGLRVDKIAANSFQKAAIRIMELGNMFEMVCHLVRRVSLASCSGGAETEPWLSIDDLQAFLEAIGVDHMYHLDLEELFEEALRFHFEFVPEGHKNHRKPADEQGLKLGSSYRNLAGAVKMGAASFVRKSASAAANAEPMMTVPISSLLAGSQKFRRVLGSIHFDRDLCFLMDTRLSVLFSEEQIRSLIPFQARSVAADTVLYDSTSSGAGHWFVLQRGECAVHMKGETDNNRPIFPGEFFGAYTALRGPVDKALAFVVTATQDCKVAELPTNLLMFATQSDSSLQIALAQLMAEAALLSAAQNSQGVGVQRPSQSLNLKSKNLSRSYSNLKRFAPMSRKPRNDGNSGRPGGDPSASQVEVLTVQETEKRTIREMVKSIEHMWSDFSMGSSSIPRKQLFLIFNLLGEVSSELFKTMFLSRKLPATISAEVFWQCWVDFLSDESFGDGLGGLADDVAIETMLDDAAFNPNLEEDGEQTAAGPVEDDFEDEEDKPGCFERLHARFAPSRSLAHRFFEEETLDTYETVWRDVVGDTQRGLPYAQIPQFLARLFTDYGYRITPYNVQEFQVAFGRDKDDTKAVNYEDINKVIRDQKLGMGNVSQGPFIGYTLNPTWPLLQRWKILIRLCAVYYLVMVPVRVAFLPWDHMLHPTALLSDGIVDLLVFLNLVIQCNTAYKNRTHSWVTKRLKILRKVHLAYVVSAMPLDWFGYACGASNEATSFLRLHKMFAILACGKVSTGSTQSVTREKIEYMAKLVAIIIHWSTCLWFYLGRAYSDWFPVDDISWYVVDENVEHLTYERDGLYGMTPSSTVWDQYLLSLYWVSATLTVNGLVGDVIPQNTIEVGFTILMMVLNMTVVRWILGEVSTIIMSADNEIVKAREELELVDSFVAGSNLAPELQVEIRNHFQSVDSGSSVDQCTILPLLSHSLAVEVASFCSREYLSGVEIFKGVSDRLLDAMCVLLSETTFAPHQWIFHESEAASQLYLVVHGSVEECVETSSDVVVENVLRPPNSVGELAFFFGTRHFFSARATALGASCLTVKKDSFDSLMKLCHDEYETISQNAICVMERVSNRRGAASSRHSRNSYARSQSSRSRRSSKSSNKSSHRGSGGSHRSYRTKGSQSPQSASKKEAEQNLQEEGEEGDKATISSGASREEAVNSEIGAFDAADGGKGGKMSELKAKRKSEKVHALLSAAAAGDLAAVKKELESGAVSVNDLDLSKRSALHVAAAQGHKPVVEYLLSMGADVSLKDKFANTPLNDAVRERKDGVARLIREWVPGTRLISKGKAAAVDLCEAAFAGDLQHIRRLLVNGVGINDSDYDGRTALHLASCEGHVDTVKYLLDHKAIYDCQDRFGGTPIQDAVRHHRTEVQVVLFARGARLETGGKDFSITLCEAAAVGDLETIKTLATNGVDIGAADYDGRTALHLAAANEKVAVLEFLLSRDPPINVNPIDRFLDTPIGDAMRHERPTAISMLSQKGGLQKGSAELDSVLAEQQKAEQARRKSMREPMVLAAMQYSPEKRALQWMETRLEPTMQEKTRALVQSLDGLQRALTALTLNMADSTGGGVTWAAEAGSRRRLIAPATEKLQSAIGNDDADLPGAAAPLQRDNLHEGMRQGMLQSKDKKKRAEDILEQIRDVKSSVLSCMSVLEGGGSMASDAPIDCKVWKAASRQYAEEGRALKRQLRSMSELLGASRKLMKELIKVEDRQARTAFYTGAWSPGAPRR